MKEFTKDGNYIFQKLILHDLIEHPNDLPQPYAPDDPTCDHVGLANGAFVYDSKYGYVTFWDEIIMYDPIEKLWIAEEDYLLGRTHLASYKDSPQPINESSNDYPEYYVVAWVEQIGETSQVCSDLYWELRDKEKES